MALPWTLDFETEAIDGHIPPEPVSLAVRSPRGKRAFYSWGHPGSPRVEKDEQEARELVFKLCKEKVPLLFHNAKFDVGVMSYHWQVAPRDRLLIHDTLYMLFFNDPYSPNLSLKPSAERLLNWPPEEKNEMEAWILANVKGATPKTVGSYIARAPYRLVKPYALGDVDRTFALYKLLMEEVERQGMLPAYQREQKLMPIFYESEQRGVRLDRELLEADLEDIFEPALVRIEKNLRKKLKAPDLVFSEREQLADALENSGYVDEWVRTPTGRRSTSKENLEKAINNPSMLTALRYRGALAGALQTFGRPWLEDSARDGRLHTLWNQVRTRGAKADAGTRTGRLSTSRPNLLNVPNEYHIKIPRGYPAPPYMRRYMLPEEGCKWLKRDFSGQEVRWLAHFEGGALLAAYQETPTLDPHQTITDIIAGILGITYPRLTIKRVVFGIIYGQGDPSLAEQLGLPKHVVSSIRKAIYTAFPAIRHLQKDVKARGKSGGQIRTWGGRLYSVEPPVIKGGRAWTFEYKLINYLIQGSSADQTKDCLIEWYDSKSASSTFLAAVHDEVNISATEGSATLQAMDHLRECMDRDIADVPMRSEGFIGDNWFDLESAA